MKSSVAAVAGPLADNAALTLLKLLYEEGSSLTAAVTDVLAKLDLTASQAEMLWALEPNAPPMPMRDLARKLHCDPSNVTLMSDKLVKAGLIERQPDPTDGRRRILALTDQGLKVWTVLTNSIQERSPIFRLSRQEQAPLSTLLQKAHERLPRSNGPHLDANNQRQQRLTHRPRGLRPVAAPTPAGT